MRHKSFLLTAITFIILVVAVSFLFQNETLSATSNTITAPAKNGNATHLTNQLLRLAGRLEQTPPERREAILTQLIETAAQRQVALFNELERDPRDFLLLALPAKVLDRLPGEIQEYLEQHVEVEGALKVAIEDDLEHARSTDVYLLVSGEEPGSTYTLHFAANPPGPLAAAVITARGVALGGHLVLAQGGGKSLEKITSSAKTFTGGEKSLETIASSFKTYTGGEAFGDQRIAVLLLNFQNDPSEPYSHGDIASLLFEGPDSTNQYYQETSFDQVSLSGDIFGWYTVPYDSRAGCNDSSWESAADQAAAAQGIDLSVYPRHVYIWPRSISCSWSGKGTLSIACVGAYCHTTVAINGAVSVFLLAHELGHNFKNHHATRLNCGALAIDDFANCSTTTYGDIYDVMGAWNTYHYNAPHKLATGWIPSKRADLVKLNGLYTIARLEVAGSAVQVLKIARPNPKGVNPKPNEFYYVEYSQPVGFDATLPAGITGGVVVHIGSSNPKRITRLLDLHPETPQIDDAALADGESFYDQINGIKITQVSHNDTYATVSVSFGPVVVTCTSAAPAVDVSPLSQVGSAGQLLSYTVEVTNQDSEACSDSEFGLASTNLLADWMDMFSPTSLTLAPGETQSATWSVTSAPVAANGSYLITSRAADVADAGHYATVDATYVVFADTEPPTVSITSPTDGTEIANRVSVNATASDNDGVARVEFYIDGDLRSTDTSSPYSYTWHTQKVSAGPHTIMATAWDAAGLNASHTITVMK